MSIIDIDGLPKSKVLVVDNEPIKPISERSFGCNVVLESMPISDRRILMRRKLLYGIGSLSKMVSKQSVLSSDPIQSSIVFTFSCGLIKSMYMNKDAWDLLMEGAPLDSFLHPEILHYKDFDEWASVEEQAIRNFCIGVQKNNA